MYTMSTSIAGRRHKAAYHHGRLKASLLHAAGNLLEKQGVEYLSLREAARLAGVSHNAPYRHFPDRDALLAALAGEGFAMLGRALEEGGKSGPLARGAAYVRFALEHPCRFRLMFGGGLRFDAHPALQAQAGRAYDGLVRSFATMGDPRGAEVAAAAAWSLTHGLANLLLEGHFRRATQDGRETQAFVRAVLGAIRIMLAPQRSA
jgi:AcrR family transcriptional regulator